MTFMPANGCFIDYGSGGSLTMRVLIMIKNADPSTIMGYANNIRGVLQAIEALRGDLAQVPNKQLPEAWPTGAASQAARQRLNWLFSNDCFGSVNKGAGAFAGELGGAAGQLQKAQQIYNKTVAVMNGVVGALLSNPWTHGAGVALAHSVVNIIDGFMKIVARILDALHVAKLIKLVNDIIKVVDSVKKILDAVHGGPSRPSLPGTSTTFPGTPPTFPTNGTSPVFTPPFFPSTGTNPATTTTGPGTTTTGTNGNGPNGNGTVTTPTIPTTDVGLPGGYNGTNGSSGTGGYNGGYSPGAGGYNNGYNGGGYTGGSSASTPPGGPAATTPGWVPVNPTDPGTSSNGGGIGTGGSGATTGGAPGSTGATTGTGAINGGTTGTGAVNGGTTGHAGGETITIEVSKDGLKVRTPGDLHQDFNVHVDATVDGERVSGDVNIDV